MAEYTYCDVCGKEVEARRIDLSKKERSRLLLAVMKLYEQRGKGNADR